MLFVVVALFSAGYLHTGLRRLGRHGLVLPIETRAPRASIDRIYEPSLSMSIAALSQPDGRIYYCVKERSFEATMRAEEPCPFLRQTQATIDNG